MAHLVRQASVAILYTSLFLIPPACRASLIADISDGGTVVGTLSPFVDSFGDESATFTLLSPYRFLMNDALGDDFRFFQVIYYDDEPTTWNGNIITPAGATAHSGTLVDTPSGGWDYEQPGGDDAIPFYESDTANNPSTGQPYAFPTLSYPALHSPDGTNPGYSSTLDAPGLAGPNHQTLFDTFVVYEDPALAAQQTFDVLGGYSWGIFTDAGGSQFGINPAGVVITPSLLTELDGALGRSGFSGWTAQYQSTFADLPEPATWLLVAAGVAGLVLGRRRCLSYPRR